MSLFSEVKASAGEWLDSVHDGGARWKYNRSMMRPWGVESSGMAVRLNQEVLDRAPTPAQRAGWVQEIQGWQDGESGLFRDPLIREGDRVPNAVHSWEHIWLHHSGICAEALRSLGAEPLHPMPGALVGLSVHGVDQRKAADWVLSMNWENPWLVGEHFFRGIQALFRAEAHASIESAFGTLEGEILNPLTGYPDRRCRNGVHSAMAGLFKVMFAYRVAGRQLPAAERAVDSTLALQDDKGGMGMDNMCIHWDAAWVMKNLNAQLGGRYGLDRIRAAGRRLGRFLMDAHRKPDGGFSFHQKHCVSVHNSIRVSKPLPESDIMGTLMCCWCLQYAEEWDAGVATPTND